MKNRPTRTVESVLVVVDVQKVFLPLNRTSTNNIELLVKDAVEKQIPVVLLEFKGRGSTIRQITQHLKGYKHYSIQKKTTTGGSDQVNDACRILNIKPKKYVFCGYHAGACVYSTVQGMQHSENQLILVKEATNLEDGTLKAYRSFQNFRLHSMHSKNRAKI